MNIVMFGLPACGKGTQAAKLKEAYGLETFSTGDMLRRMKERPGPIGDSLRALPTGSFASDELILKAVAEELQDPRFAKGVIFDGFPRTVEQAKALEALGRPIDAVAHLRANENDLIERGVNRRVHLSSGRIYNLKSAPPKKSGRDDVTGEELTWRDDDKAEVMERRFADYRAKTMPALEFLSAQCKANSGPVMIELDAMRPSDEVFEELSAAIEAARALKALRSGRGLCVALESSFEGDAAESLAYCRAAMADSLLKGEAPLASSALYAQAGQTDGSEGTGGLGARVSAQGRLEAQAGLLLKDLTAKTVVYGDLGISEPMREAIARAAAAGRAIEYRSLPGFDPSEKIDEKRAARPGA